MLLNPRSGIDRNLFHPDYIVETVDKIDFAWLQSRGIKAVLIDLDGTVVARGTYDVDARVTAYLKKQSMDIYIATNRPKSRDLKNLKDALNASGVIHPVGIIGKPFPTYYAQAASEHHLDPKEVAMIGDRFLQDIFGANLAGLTTILIRKIDKPTNFLDAQLSRLEKRYTDRLGAKYLPAVDSK